MIEASDLVGCEVGQLGGEIIDHCKKQICWVASDGIVLIYLTIWIDRDSVAILIDRVSKRSPLPSGIASGLLDGFNDSLQGLIGLLKSCESGVGGSNLVLESFNFLK